MRTIVFRLGTRSRGDLQDFLHSRLNFEFTDISWLDAGHPLGDRVPVRFFNDILAVRALVLWTLFRRRSARPGPAPRPHPITTSRLPHDLKLRPLGLPHRPAPARPLEDELDA